MIGGEDPDPASPRDRSMSLTPSKRNRIDDHLPIAILSSGRGTPVQEGLYTEAGRNEGVTAAQLEKLLTNQIMPLLIGKMGDRFNTIQSQYETTVNQASKLFGEVQTAMVSLRSQQMQLSAVMVTEQKH